MKRRMTLNLMIVGGLAGIWLLPVARAEDALKDGNRVPTLLYDLNGSPKRVSHTSPLPVTVADQSGLTAVTIASQALPVPVKISTQAAPVTVSVNNQPSSMTVTIANQVTPVPVAINSQVAPVAVAASQPFPVTVTNQIPSTSTVSVGVEKIGPGTITLITPSSGKKIAVRGAAIMMETATGGEADVRFASGALIFKIYRGDQSGAVIPVFRDGAVNESVQAVVTNVSAGQKVFLVVNYEEK